MQDRIVSENVDFQDGKVLLVKGMFSQPLKHFFTISLA